MSLETDDDECPNTLKKKRRNSVSKLLGSILAVLSQADLLPHSLRSATKYWEKKCWDRGILGYTGTFCYYPCSLKTPTVTLIFCSACILFRELKELVCMVER